MAKGFDPEKFTQDFQRELAGEEGSSQTGVGPEELPTPDGAPVAGPERAPETIGEKLARLRRDLEERARKFARLDLDTSGRWTKLKKLLGANIKEAKDPGVGASEKDFNEALWQYVVAKRENLPAGDREATRALLKYIYLGGAVDLRSFKAEENVEMKREKGEWSDKYVDHYKKGKDWWKNLSLKKKLAYSGAVFAVGVTGVGASFASIGAMTLATKLTTRVLGAGVMYESAKKWQEALDVNEAEYMANQMINQILEQDDWQDRIMNLTKEEVTGAVKERKARFESLDLINKRRAYLLAMIMPVIATAVDVYKWGFGGGGKVVGVVPESGSPKAPVGTPDMKGYGGGPPMVEDSPAPSGVKLSVLEEMAQKTPAAGAEVPAPEIAKPQFKEIASGNFGKGGSIEGKIFQSIKANPSAYGLNPDDPNFSNDVQKMTRNISEEFASRKGFASYEDFDNYCRKHVQPGDGFKIIYDPGTEEIHLDYEGKAFGADVAQSAPVQEVEISKPKVAPPEELRTKTGPAEYPAQKSASQIRGMEELDANQKLAQQKYARAVQAEEYLKSLHERQAAHLENVGQEAHLRQVLATRGLLNRIIEGAGIGSNVSFWEGSALDWHDKIVNVQDYVAQDVQMADEVNKLNLNLGQLKNLFLKLGKPELGQSMGDYLQEAMKNSRNTELINQIISRE